MPAALLLAFRPAGIEDRQRVAFERVAAAFPDRVRAMRVDELVEPSLCVRTWDHDAAIGDGIARDVRRGGWAAVLGNPIGESVQGARPREVPARILAAGLAGVATLSPPFAVALAADRGGPVHVAVDRCGIQHLYRREAADGTIWLSSSVLALADALGGTLDADAAAEWLAAGHFVSERTLVREVRKVGAGESLRLDGGGCTVTRRWRPEPGVPAADGHYRSALVAAIEARDGNGGTVAELTGGLDSRLVLAGRLAAGLGTSSWTIGAPGSVELRTVGRLRSAVGFDHVTAPVTPPRSVAAVVREMHALSDGEVNALEYAPLLNALRAVEGRWQVSMSGAGGETARGYYYAAIKHGAVDLDVLAGKLSAATRPVVAALSPERFPHPLEPLRGALEGLLADSRLDSAENRAEEVYLLGRMQRFAGRNTSTTGYFYRQALPYFADELVDVSLRLPVASKVDGRVMRDAIASLAPALARIPLDSGVGVPPRSWRRPTTRARWAAAMGRKVIERHGGSLGRRLAAPSPVPWTDWRVASDLPEFVRATLPPGGSRIDEILEPTAKRRLVEDALAGGPLYPLGLVLTLELTLERISSPPKGR